MYFSNLLDERGVGTFNRSKRPGVIPFIGSVTERSAVGHVKVVNKQIVVDNDPNGDVFLKGITEDSSSPFLEKYKTGFTCREVMDTESNPMIAVLARSIKFYVGIKTFVKFINIADDAVLACLVYGACEFTFDDGVSVALQRCNTSDLDGRKLKEFSGKELRELCNLEDKQSGYNLEWDSVCPVIVNLTSENTGVYKAVKEHMVLFTTEGLEAARVKAEEKKKQAEAEAKQREERRKQFEAEMKAKRKKQEEEEARKKAEKEAKRAARLNSKAKKEEVYETVNMSGAAFLEIISNL